MTSDIWFQTFSGKIFHHDDPENYKYTINEISEVLSRKNRFGDHIHQDYKVSDHCLLVAHLYLINSCIQDPIKRVINTLYSLLHDSQEAYYGDIVSPLRKCISNFKREGSYIELSIGADVMDELEDLEDICQNEIMSQLVLNNLREKGKHLILTAIKDSETIKECDAKALKIESDILHTKKPKKWFCDDIEVNEDEIEIFHKIFPHGHGLWTAKNMFLYNYQGQMAQLRNLLGIDPEEDIIL